jgi:hypothetical protein
MHDLGVSGRIVSVEYLVEKRKLIMKFGVRRLSILALSILVCLTLFAGCGETDDADANTGNDVSNQNNGNQNNGNQNNSTASGFTIEIDSAASTLTVTEGGSVEVTFIVENHDDDAATANVEFSLGGHTDETELEVDGGSSASSSFTWETADGDAGNYTAEVSIGDVSDSVSVAVNEEGGGGDAFFEIMIDEAESTLEVTEGETLIIMIVATNTGTEEGIIDFTGQVEMEGGGIGQLELEQQGGDADTPIPPNQGMQIEAQLPTGPGEEDLSAGEHSLTINSQHDSASTQLTVLAPQ